MITPKVKFQDLDRISYKDAWKYQTEILGKIKEIKLANRDLLDNGTITTGQLLFCEHNPVYTLGKSGSIDHLLLNEKELAQGGFEYYKINRGGDITYHGPGQLTVYPIFDLDHFFHDVHRYVRCLEEVVIRTLDHFNIKGERIEDFTGVWLVDKDQNQKKICAIGVHMSRWITMHGLALNVNTNINHFDNIIPCGIQEEGKEVTSLEKELGHKIEMDEVKTQVKKSFREVFQFEYTD